MKQKILHITKKLITHELVTGSFYLFLGTTIANVFAFILNLFLARKFSYAQYGEYTALIFLIAIVSTPAQSFIPVIMKFCANYFAKEQLEKVSQLYKRVFTLFFGFAALLLLLFALFSQQIQTFLHIKSNFLIIFSSVTIIAMYLNTVNTAFLQGQLQFGFAGFLSALGGTIKAICSVVFVSLGFGVFGGLTGFFMSFLLPFLLAYIPLRKYVFHPNKGQIHMKEISFYALPTVITMFALTSFTTTDLLLVKHFFTSYQAGLYAGLSLIGRIIFYFSAPISSVMFPLIIKQYEQKKNFHNIFFLALLLVFIPSLCITMFYFLYPGIAVRFFLGGKDYIKISPYIGFFGLYLTLFSLLNVLVMFFLSLNKTRVTYIVAGASVMQAVGIYFFHKDFMQIITISFSLSIVLLIMLLLYYFKLYGKRF